MVKKIPRNLIYVIVGVVVLVGLLVLNNQTQEKPQSVSLSRLLEETKKENVESIKVNGPQLQITL